MSFKETRGRSLTKTATWRVIAVLNSYLVLVGLELDSHFQSAIAINITGFSVFYVFERVWDQISWGRTKL